MNLDNQLIIIRNIDGVQDININNEDYIVIGVIGPTGPKGPRGPEGPRGPQGIQGPQGIAGQDGTDGTDGADGFSPIANVTQDDGVTTIIITDQEGTTTASIDMNDYYTKDEVDESQNQQNEEINIINNIINQMPKVTGSGTSITLNNTIEAPMKLELNPSELEQETTTGKNLLPITLTSQTLNGVQITRNNDGSITLNGTTNANTNFIWFNGSITLNAGTYYIGLKTISNDMNLYLVNGGNTIIHQPINVEYDTLTLSSSKTYTSLRSYAVSGKTFNNVTFYPMITKTLPFTYEPYTGGIASPNPSYPQQIHTISGDNEIVVSNKNLFDKNTFTYVDKKRLDDNGNVVNDNDSSYSTSLIQVKPNTTYTIQGTQSITGKTTRIYYYSSSQVFMSRSNSYSTDSYSFTTPVNCYYIALQLRNSDYINTNIIQLEQGSTPTSYIEHKEQVKEIDLDGNNLLDLSTLVQGYYITSANPTITGTTDGRFRSFTMALKKGTYTICFDKNANSVRAFSNYDYSGDAVLTNYYNAKSGTFTLTQDGIVYFSFRKNDGTDWDNNADLVWLVKGNEALPYEPYNSIEYCKIGDYKYEFLLTSGKNLFDKDNSYDSSLYSLARNVSNITYNNGILTITPTGTGNVRVVINANLSAGTYTLNSNNSLSETTQLRNNNEDTLYNFRNNYSNQTFTLSSASTKMWFNWSNPNNTNPFTLNLNSLMINEGTTALDYEPYGTEQWYIKKKIGKVVLDGTENWSLDSNNSRFYSNSIITDYNVVNRTSSLCSHYTYNGTPYFALSGSGNILFLGYPNENINTIPLFKTWLGTNLPNVYYILATPTYTLLNDTLQEQLTDIYNTLKSYNGQTNISQINNDLGFTIKASALLDLNTLIGGN